MYVDEAQLDFRSVAAVVSRYCFIIAAAVIVLWLGGIVSVVCSIVLSKGCKPFMGDLTRAATLPGLLQKYLNGFVFLI